MSQPPTPVHSAHCCQMKHPKRPFIGRFSMTLHCFWIISRPLHLTFKSLPRHLTSIHISRVVAHSSPAWVLLFSSQTDPFVIPIKSRWFLSSVLLQFFNCRLLKEEHQTWSLNTKIGIPFMGYMTSISSSEKWDNACLAESFLIRSASTWRNMPWDLLHTCVHVCAHVHMHDKK